MSLLLESSVWVPTWHPWLVPLLWQSPTGRNDGLRIDLAYLGDRELCICKKNTFLSFKCWAVFFSGASPTLKIADLGINTTPCDISQGSLWRTNCEAISPRIPNSYFSWSYSFFLSPFVTSQVSLSLRETAYCPRGQDIFHTCRLHSKTKTHHILRSIPLLS